MGLLYNLELKYLLVSFLSKESKEIVFVRERKCFLMFVLLGSFCGKYLKRSRVLLLHIVHSRFDGFLKHLNFVRCFINVQKLFKVKPVAFVVRIVESTVAVF
jgi:hypothetical protein